MALLDDITAGQQTYSCTAGGSRLDLILADLDALPKTGDFPQENYERLIEMLESPVTAWGHKQLTGIVRQLCAALGVDDRELNKHNVTQWRNRRWGEM